MFIVARVLYAKRARLGAGMLLGRANTIFGVDLVSFR